MNHRAGLAKPLLGGKRFWIIAAVGLILILVGAALRGCQYSRLANKTTPASVSKTTTQIINVRIQPDCWTDWLKLPPGTAFRVNAPGWHRYQFWTGEQRVVEENEVRWFGTVPASTFRLKGAEGEVTIYYD